MSNYNLYSIPCIYNVINYIQYLCDLLCMYDNDLLSKKYGDLLLVNKHMHISFDLICFAIHTYWWLYFLSYTSDIIHILWQWLIWSVCNDKNLTMIFNTITTHRKAIPISRTFKSCRCTGSLILLSYSCTLLVEN